MTTVFQCKRCNWEGTTDEMDHTDEGFFCPRCGQELPTDGTSLDSWTISIEDDEEDEEYDDNEMSYGYQHDFFN